MKVYMFCSVLNDDDAIYPLSFHASLEDAQSAQLQYHSNSQKERWYLSRRSILFVGTVGENEILPLEDSLTHTVGALPSRKSRGK